MERKNDQKFFQHLLVLNSGSMQVFDICIFGIPQIVGGIISTFGVGVFKKCFPLVDTSKL